MRSARPGPAQVALFPGLMRQVDGEPEASDRWRVDEQQPLFPPTRPPPVSLVDDVAGLSALASRLPPGLRFGTSSWTFPGWPIWRSRYAMDRLVNEGLAAYATHPLFRTVGIDRTWYRPVDAAEFGSMQSKVPADFSFLVKAHEDLTMRRFPHHERYGPRAGRENDRFLSVQYAMDEVVGPFVEGLGDGVLLFPFAPQGGLSPGKFADQLFRFLQALPKGPWRYAVEVRNPDLLTPAYADALEATGALPALVGWPGMPTIPEQARRTRALSRPERVVRWMLHPGLKYEEAKADYGPFTVLKAPDLETRGGVVEVIRGAKAAWVVVNNKAEGCAPLSIGALAGGVVGTS